MSANSEHSESQLEPGAGPLDGERNRDARAIAMTVCSPVRPWYRRSPSGWYQRGLPWLSAVFTAGRAFPERSETIRKLSFIHFARWIVIRRLPDHGQPRERLKQPLLMFESNYNGSFDQYIDGFANILTSGMTYIWGTSYGFPGPKPVAPFKKYINGNEFQAAHYYSAYPGVTITMATSALTVEQELEKLGGRTEDVEPEVFAAEYRAFLTKCQRHL